MNDRAKLYLLVANLEFKMINEFPKGWKGLLFETSKKHWSISWCKISKSV